MSDEQQQAIATVVAEVTLVKPSFAELPSYVAALRQGWSPDNVRLAEAIRDHLEKIASDPAAFLASLDDEAAEGDPIPLPDGSLVPRLPGFVRWMWDGDFCGVIGFRWQPGTSALPAHVPGHVGFAVVPWKRGAGYAKRALAILLPEAARHSLSYVELTTDPANAASQTVIRACGGDLLERYRKPAVHGGGEGLRYRIPLRGAVV